MTEAESGFPRRDADGRILAVTDLLGLVLAGLVIGLLALLVFDGGFSLLGFGDFGGASGWLAVILPAWAFVEEFRAWSFGAARVVVALVGVAVSVTFGLLVAGLLNEAGALWSGVAAAAAFALAYSLIWFYGIRWLAHRTG
ncbi:hypothetical protein RB614_28400 [Phytohabitans sp. ZYX-F-186]|uniref:DUF3054 domain-containing protein n=1 Tax=Phytohabitans maris TaxID=3071409 RepID=A0ABU0ZN46_9ACTN|nr:hypothetical protein [Phytohabitans sp. ZYX-F-186]MDQ7908456.1 hypothetical protein [Phytohabitans sp. ZYX-F-186]